MHSSAAMGNFDADDEDDAHVGGQSSSSSSSNMNLAACPLTLPSLKALVESLGVAFPTTSTTSASDRDFANHHLASLVEKAISTWSKETVSSSQVLEKASVCRDATATSFRTKGASRNLSLLALQLPQIDSTHARFVHWQNVGQSGRPIDLDEHGRVKALVCVGALRVAMDLSNAYVIHPDVGVPMLRARGYKKQERPQMPDDMRRLQAMCDIALQTDLLPSSSGCLLCRTRMSVVAFPETLGVEQDTFQCPCCLQSLGLR